MDSRKGTLGMPRDSKKETNGDPMDPQDRASPGIGQGSLGAIYYNFPHAGAVSGFFDGELLGDTMAVHDLPFGATILAIAVIHIPINAIYCSPAC